MPKKKTGHEIDVTLDLAALGLAHAPGSTCECKGKAHPVTISIEPEQHELHLDADCPADRADAVETVFQSLHEQAHPEGAVFAENCRERGCYDAIYLP
jgi:hypothetical protein